MEPDLRHLSDEPTPPDSDTLPWCSRCETDEHLLIESVESSGW